MAVSKRIAGSQRREIILSAAFEKFADRGFHGVTTHELAQAAGVSEPVLYQHFPSKSDLYRAVIEGKIDGLTTIAEQFFAICKSAQSVEELIRELALLLLRWFKADPHVMRLLYFTYLERHELADTFVERIRDQLYRELKISVGRLFQRDDIHFPTEIAVYMISGVIRTQFSDRVVFPHLIGAVPDEEIVSYTAGILASGFAGSRNTFQPH